MFSVQAGVRGFKVIDLGVDVGPEKFVERVKATDSRLICMSVLLTTTMPGGTSYFSFFVFHCL